jgi:hypothetical protein
MYSATSACVFAIDASVMGARSSTTMITNRSTMQRWRSIGTSPNGTTASGSTHDAPVGKFGVKSANLRSSLKETTAKTPDIGDGNLRPGGSNRRSRGDPQPPRTAVESPRIRGGPRRWFDRCRTDELCTSGGLGYAHPGRRGGTGTTSSGRVHPQAAITKPRRPRFNPYWVPLMRQPVASGAASHEERSNGGATGHGGH